MSNRDARDPRAAEDRVEEGRRLPAGSGPAGPGLLREEVVVVLSLSLLSSAVFALIDLLSAPIAGVTVALYPQVGLASQLASIVFGLAPVALVVHLSRRSAEGLRPFGLEGSTIRMDVAFGLALGVLVALVGALVYVVSVAAGVNRFVVPVPPLGHWWTWPIVVLGAGQASLLEEVIVVGYLIRRLEQIGWSSAAGLGASAALRGAYHLYQGWGGFAGNLALGLLFGAVFLRLRKTWPLVVAHFTIDVLSALAYVIARGHCFFGACVR